MSRFFVRQSWNSGMKTPSLIFSKNNPFPRQEKRENFLLWRIWIRRVSSWKMTTRVQYGLWYFGETCGTINNSANITVFSFTSVSKQPEDMYILSLLVFDAFLFCDEQFQVESHLKTSVFWESTFCFVRETLFLCNPWYLLFYRFSVSVREQLILVWFLEMNEKCIWKGCNLIRQILFQNFRLIFFWWKRLFFSLHYFADFTRMKTIIC